jgi:hypothetical protein
VASWKKVVGTAEFSATAHRDLFSVRFGEERRKRLGVPSFSDLEDCSFLAMSDTLVMVVQAKHTDNALQNALFWLAGASHGLFVRALKEGIYFRGVMSCGEFYGSPEEKLMVGPAVDEAMEWFTEPDWIGVSTAPSAFFLAERAHASGSVPAIFKNVLTKWHVPMRDGKAVESWVIDWPRLDPTLSEPPDEIRLLELFAAKPIGHDALSKYTNTLAFFRKRREEQQRQDATADPSPAAQAPH